MHKQAQCSLFYLLINNGKNAKRIAKQIVQQRSGSAQSLPFALLSQIDEGGNTLAQLTQRLQCSKQETTRQVQLAESHGWVSLQPSETDKRAKIVMLTDFACKQLAQGVDFYQSLEQQLLQGLSEQECEQLMAAQKKLQSLLKDFELTE